MSILSKLFLAATCLVGAVKAVPCTPVYGILSVGEDLTAEECLMFSMYVQYGLHGQRAVIDAALVGVNAAMNTTFTVATILPPCVTPSTLGGCQTNATVDAIYAGRVPAQTAVGASIAYQCANNQLMGDKFAKAVADNAAPTNLNAQLGMGLLVSKYCSSTDYVANMPLSCAPIAVANFGNQNPMCCEAASTAISLAAISNGMGSLITRCHMHPASPMDVPCATVNGTATFAPSDASFMKSVQAMCSANNTCANSILTGLTSNNGTMNMALKAGFDTNADGVMDLCVPATTTAAPTTAAPTTVAATTAAVVDTNATTAAATDSNATTAAAAAATTAAPTVTTATSGATTMVASTMIVAATSAMALF